MINHLYAFIYILMGDRDKYKQEVTQLPLKINILWFFGLHSIELGWEDYWILIPKNYLSIIYYNIQDVYALRFIHTILIKDTMFLSPWQSLQRQYVKIKIFRDFPREKREWSFFHQ